MANNGRKQSANPSVYHIDTFRIGALSTDGMGQVPRGRPEIGDFRDHENRRFSNDLTPRRFTVS